MPVASIYGLYDQQGRLRYIGKAVNPESRLKSHMRERRRKTPLYDWLAKHGAPEMRILESDCADWVEAERRLIAEARARGELLLNIADGGDEPYCPTEQRAANARAMGIKVHADPLRKRIWYLKKQLGTALRGGYLPNSARAKMRYAAQKRPDLFGDWLTLLDRVEP